MKILDIFLQVGGAKALVPMVVRGSTRLPWWRATWTGSSTTVQGSSRLVTHPEIVIYVKSELNVEQRSVYLALSVLGMVAKLGSLVLAT